MNPIPTEYNSVKYRSRLEARWAVFFDHLGVAVEYEAATLTLPGFGDYTPDFVIETQYFAEVKPVWPTRLEIEKGRAAADYCMGVIFLIGWPDYRCYWMLTLESGKRDELPILLTPLDGRDVGTLFPKATDPQTASVGIPPSAFPFAYRQAVEASRRAKFDGYDNDRGEIQRRYA